LINKLLTVQQPNILGKKINE